ncbi:hypothetical protein AVEN_183345-1 [Araneus ventricosus]|uniref:Uncharacterized protein n=1 Tax=Araneus ventricosus TaxID=182803 RepID=A0A4Y2PUL4_ARAVE|nr:hypothetical protein AVEN_183345-1 [Araneus ventricosus]
MKFLFYTCILLSVSSLTLTSVFANMHPSLESSHLDRNSNDGLRKPLERIKRAMAPQGVSKPFCDMFGCHNCQTPPGSQCCRGYAYDSSAKRCREVVTSS